MKNTLIVILIFFVNSISSQITYSDSLFNNISHYNDIVKGEGVIHLKKGKQLEGFIKFSTQFDRVTYRRTKNGSKDVFYSTSVKSIIIKNVKDVTYKKTLKQINSDYDDDDDDNDNDDYSYKRDVNYIDVEYEYKRLNGRTKPSLLKIVEKGKVTLYEYTFSQNNKVIFIGKNYSKNVIKLKHNFRKRLITYFIDCPEVSNKLKKEQEVLNIGEEIFNISLKEDLIRVVKLYNAKCHK